MVCRNGSDCTPVVIVRFFEDVETMNPTLYLIHNLLTKEEADELMESARTKVEPLESNVIDVLQMNTQPDNFPGVERVMLWQGTLASPAQKAIEERIEQVTGFPSAHFSDFIVDKLEPGAKWNPHYDKDPSSRYPTPIATIILFLGNNGEVVYPTSNNHPIKIESRKGLAIVHHNLNENDEIDLSTLHATLPIEEQTGPAYIARKYVFETPISNARRTILPAYAYLLGGKLPKIVVIAHDLLVESFGIDDGGLYFDKTCIFLPGLFLLLLAQVIFTYVKDQMFDSSETTTTTTDKDDSKKKKAGTNPSTTVEKKRKNKQKKETKGNKSD